MGEISELIVHDPGLGPFLKRPITACFDAGMAGSICLVFATEPKVERPASDCIEVIRRQDLGRYQQFIAVPENPLEMRPEDYHEWCLADYRISLVNRRDMLKTFAYPAMDAASFAQQDDVFQRMSVQSRLARGLQGALEKLEQGWYWCVAGYFKAALVVLWLFRVNGASGARWDRRIEFRYPTSQS